jgi:hypothetical protein
VEVSSTLIALLGRVHDTAQSPCLFDVKAIAGRAGFIGSAILGRPLAIALPVDGAAQDRQISRFPYLSHERFQKYQHYYQQPTAE